MSLRQPSDPIDMTTAPLVAIGDNCLDAFLSKDMLAVGGNALNVAVQWRRMGRDARYFGTVGPDPEGDVMLAEIETAGLRRGDVEVRPGETAVTLLRDREGDRIILTESLGVGENYMPAPSAFAAVSEAAWVHLGTHSNPDLVHRLATEKVSFSVDVSTHHDALSLRGVPLVFASGSDEAGFDPAPLIARLRALGAGRVVVTCGSRGAFFDDGSHLRHAPAMPVDVVDTCGAGDSFIATFVTAHLVDRRDADEALRMACAAAGETCRHLGGFPQTLRRIPDWLPKKYAGVIAAGQEA